MSSTNQPESDSVETLLGFHHPGSNDGLRQNLLGQTSGVVRRRRRVRRGLFSAALAGCYLAGIATTQLWTLSAGPGAPGATAGLSSSEVGKLNIHRSSTAGRASSGTQRFPLVSANYENIRRVSDRYLYEEGDLAFALRCYGRALDKATPQERTVLSEEDSWLLKAIKLARIEETKHDNDES